jgi:hypothetical protein
MSTQPTSPQDEERSRAIPYCSAPNANTSRICVRCMKRYDYTGLIKAGRSKRPINQA